MLIAVVIHSFGYLHGDMPTGDGLLVDLRTALRNPHHDPAVRYLTGTDPVVRDHVLTTPGATAILRSIVHRVAALLDGYANRHGEHVAVFIGCQGGRHRSVAVAEEAADRLRQAGIGVEVTHHHVDRPVIGRTSTAPARCSG